VVLVKTGVNLAVAFVYGAVLLGLMLLTTDQSLRLAPVAVVSVGLLALATAVGVGLALGGLALVYKRIENVFQLVQFAFVALIAAPVEEVAGLKLLPLALGSHLLRLVMVEGRSLWELPSLDLALLVVVAVAYLGAGYAVFGVAVRLARRRGTLGAY
jgi:ABC-2 type transport system permease protein